MRGTVLPVVLPVIKCSLAPSRIVFTTLVLGFRVLSFEHVLLHCLSCGVVYFVDSTFRILI